MVGMRHVAAALMATVAVVGATAQAPSKPGDVHSFDIPGQDLGDALRAVTARAGWELYATSSDVNGVAAPPLHGSLSLKAAIDRLLRGSGLSARYSDGAVIIRGRSKAAEIGTSSAANSEIVVTGTHIRGAVNTANVITMSRADIENAGQSDLGEAVRSIPQNFNGGQNPGVGQGAGLTNTNLNSASSINLRGLGTDATLTLLNGHRLPYDSAFQGVDVSAIPASAIERIDILADGASALYGSDAVAGVANIVLRRDFEGVLTSAKLGASTDGGDFQQQADAVAGHRWSDGGIMIAYDFTHNSAITASQRNYTSSMLGDNTLYPAQRRHAATLAFHQDLSDSVEFSVDALYSKRWSTNIASYDAGGIPVRYFLDPTVESYSVAPELKISVGGGWQLQAVGTLGGDNSHYGGTISVGDQTDSSSGCYCNRAVSAEINADGPLIELPAGHASLAVGAGYRDNKMHSTRFGDGISDGGFRVGRDVYYAYSELSVPIVAPAQSVWGINRLTFSAAGRYEDYPGMARVATPKLGIVYQPIKDITIKGAWGRSFKAPTLYQQYVNDELDLLPAASYGVGPAGTAIAFVSGGNPNLKPERSRNWTANVTFAPATVPGLSVEAGYFDIVYKNRVVAPDPGYVSTALADPGYASLLDYSPSVATLDALFAASPLVENSSGYPYSPSTVVLLIDNRNRNVADQHIHGVDLQASYRRSFDGGRSLQFQLAGTYLASKQRITPQLPQTVLAGTIFNPPHFRLRGGATFDGPWLTLSTYVNYVGSVEDTRFTPTYHVGGNTTVDLVARIQLIPQTRGRGGLEVSLQANNVLNEKPNVIRVTGPTDTPYDSTNYSPIGRFLAVTLSRSW